MRAPVFLQQFSKLYLTNRVKCAAFLLTAVSKKALVIRSFPTTQLQGVLQCQIISSPRKENSVHPLPNCAIHPGCSSKTRSGILIMYNFSELITSYVVIQKNKQKIPLQSQFFCCGTGLQKIPSW